MLKYHLRQVIRKLWPVFPMSRCGGNIWQLKQTELQLTWMAKEHRDIHVLLYL